MRSLIETIRFAERFCRLVWWDFSPKINGMYYSEDGQALIFLAKHIASNRALIKSTLAEELGHHFTSEFKNWTAPCFSYSDRLSLDRTEYRAVRWAADFLIEDKEFIYAGQELALAGYADEIQQLSARFEVTSEIVSIKYHSLERRGLI